MKRIISLAIMFATLFTLTVPVCAEPQKTKAEIVSEFKTTVQIGTWIPYILTDDGAKTMKENGIDFIFIWWYDNYEKAIALCEKYDIKCILDAGICDNSTDDEIKASMQKSYWQSPAVIGYYIIDEPSAVKFDFIAHALTITKVEQPDLIPYVNLFPEYASSEQIGTSSFEEYMRLFTEKIDVDYISTDVYPYHMDKTDTKYLTSIDTTNQQCMKTNRDHWLHIQSMGFGANRSPSAEDLTAQMYIGLSFGVSKFMHFCYAIPHPGLYEAKDFFGASVTYTGEKTEVWNYTKAMNDELKAISPVVEKYKNVGAFTVAPQQGRAPLYINSFNEEREQYTGFNDFFKTLTALRSSIVGCFESKDGSGKRAFTLVNSAEITYSQTSKVEFSFNSPQIVTAYPNGIKTVLQPNENGVFTIDLGIGDGVFIETENAVITSGDVNSDGKVSLVDAMLSFMSVAGKTNLNYYEKCAADLDNNGTVSLSDAMKIFMNIAGKVSI